MKKNKLITLLDLYYVFAKIGTFTIGGGIAMMPMMERELINNKGWITEDDLLDYYAIGQSTPGIIAVNVATFVGFRQMGIIGGIVATLGMVTPSLVIITILAGLINSISDYPYVQKALNGVNVAVAALLTNVIYKFAKKTIKNLFNVLCMLIAFCLIFFLKVPSFWIIISALIIGVILSIVKVKKAAKTESQNQSAEEETK